MSGRSVATTVYVIEDDAYFRSALARLLRAYGFNFVGLPSIRAFMDADIDPDRACVVADIRLDDGEDGLTIPRRLTERGLNLPVIFLTAVDTEEMRAQARQAGAAAFFRKPVADQALVDAIRWAVDRSKG